jgi:rsbT antagonist protein RsbS
MAIPLQRRGDLLIATIQDALSDTEYREMQNELLGQVARARARGVILDVSSLDVVDSFGARSLSATTAMLRLRGARSVIVGIQPDVAFAMVQLGLRLDGVDTALDVNEGIAHLQRHARGE